MRGSTIATHSYAMTVQLRSSQASAGIIGFRSRAGRRPRPSSERPSCNLCAAVLRARSPSAQFVAGPIRAVGGTVILTCGPLPSTLEGGDVRPLSSPARTGTIRASVCRCRLRHPRRRARSNDRPALKIGAVRRVSPRTSNRRRHARLLTSRRATGTVQRFCSYQWLSERVFPPPT